MSACEVEAAEKGGDGGLYVKTAFFFDNNNYWVRGIRRSMKLFLHIILMKPPTKNHFPAALLPNTVPGTALVTGWKLLLPADCTMMAHRGLQR